MSDELIRTRELLNKALGAKIKADEQLKSLKSKLSEPIAIIGMSCRFPGGANSIEEFWQLLQQGYDGISEVPKDRWDIDEYYDPNIDALGKINTRKGGFLNIDVSQFDPGYFNISPKEAQLMDPQQRLLLEVTWEALANAGIEPESIKNTKTGVYVGVCSNDYLIIQKKYPHETDITPYTATGNSASVAAGRIAYILGAEGNALSVDTACSSSLVAIDIACQELRHSDLNCAIVGGANLILAPDNSITFSKAHMLSADGYCKTFDASADGYVRGEGCGVIILKRLSDAKRDGDAILALIKGSATNQDGASSGLTVPNGSAQSDVILKALQQAQLKADDIDYIETHGTGTSLGDPIEVNAIGKVLGKREKPILLSSVKTNIGHLEACAGIAGLIKTVLAMKNELIPAHKHFKHLNPLVELKRFSAEIPLKNTPWPKGDKPRSAGISSFGFSGTNAHVILTQAPADYVSTRQPLPAIQFNRQRYWFERKDYSKLIKYISEDRVNVHPFLQKRLNASDGQEIFFESEINTNWPEFVAHHGLFEIKVIAGSTHISVMLAALAEVDENLTLKLANIQFEEPLALNVRQNYRIQTCVNPKASQIKISSQLKSNRWRNHASASIQSSETLTAPLSFADIKQTATLIEGYDIALHQQRAQSFGLNLDHHHLWLKQVFRTPQGLLVEMRRPEELEESQGYVLYPGYIDSCFQSFIAAMDSVEQLYVPVALDAVIVERAAGFPVWVYLESASFQVNEKVDFWLFNADGLVVGQFKGLQFKPIQRATLQKLLEREGGNDTHYFIPEWNLLNFTTINLEEAYHNAHCLIVGSKKVEMLAVQLKILTGQVKQIQFDELSNISLNEYQHIFIELNNPGSLPENYISATQSIVRLVQKLPNAKITLLGFGMMGAVGQALARCIFNEVPQLSLRYFEIVDWSAASINLLLHFLNSNDNENELRLSHNQIEVMRLSPKVFDLQPDIKLQSGWYWITGGAGALSLATAHWLIKRGAQNIKLTSRHALNSDQAEKLQALKALGVDLEHSILDITDKNAIDKWLAASISTLRGIYHTAGVLQDALISEINDANIETVLAPKVIGAWNIHEVTQNLDLYECIFYSSMASILGNPGQLSYCIANAFMDALAHYRRSQQLPAISINWGPWKEAGMASAHYSQIQGQGISALNNNDYFAAIEPLLRTPLAQIMIAKINWDRVGHLKERIMPLLSHLILVNNNENGAWIALLKEKPESERGLWLRNQLRQRVRSVLGLAEHAVLNDAKGFFDLGMDSLMIINLRNQLQHLLGSQYSLNSTAMLERPTIDAIYTYFTEELLYDLFNQNQAKVTTIVRAPVDSEEPIAIIGMGCRFPGGANSIEEFWQLLQQGYDGISEVPKDRWDVDEYYDPNIDALGKINTRKGGFLNIDVSQFDPGYFNISPKEAQLMDPQQRLLLEVTWEALVSGGIKPESIKNTKTGVYMGICSIDYLMLQKKYLTEADISPYTSTGNSTSVAAGRIAYILGAQGPALTLDTACSSSLVAIDLACQELRHSDSNCAIVGGANLLLAPDNSITFSKAHMLSNDGYCKTFDASADGYVRGEGCGVIILKRLSDAKRDGDIIFALIKGSAINQDGASGGLTVPNGSAQSAVILKALQQAQLKADDIDYIEAHGTGTSLGDPVEVNAIGKVLGKREKRLLLSSVKTNIGHLEASAGVAGLIKTVLAMQNEQIPAHQHYKTLNPLIELKKYSIEIPLKNTPWPKSDKPRSAGVSSFGFSGTNAHVILTEAPKDYISTRQPLPAIQFDRKRYWFERKDFAKLTQYAADDRVNSHALLQHRFNPSTDMEVFFEAQINTHYPDFVADHALFGIKVIAGATHISTMLSALAEVDARMMLVLSNIQFTEPLVLRPGQKYQLQTCINKKTGHIEINSQHKSGRWRNHASANVNHQESLTAPADLALIQQTATLIEDYDIALHQKRAQNLGLNLGHHHLWLKKAFRTKKGLLVEMRQPSGPEETQGYLLYPGYIDSCFHSIHAIQGFDTLPVPVQLDSVIVERHAGFPSWVYVEIKSTQQGKRYNFWLFNTEGLLIAQFTGLQLRPAQQETIQKLLEREAVNETLYFEPQWISTEIPSGNLKIYQGAHCLVVGSSHLDALVKKLKTLNATVSHTSLTELNLTELDRYQYVFIALESNAIVPEDYINATQCLVSAIQKMPNAKICLLGFGIMSGLGRALTRTVFNEMPQLSIRHCEIESWSAASIELLLPLFTQDSNENEFRLNANQVTVMRLLPKLIDEQPAEKLNAGWYWITGGLGALSIATAHWLISRGAKTIKLTGRSAPNDEQKQALSTLTASGVAIEHGILDITDIKAIKKWLLTQSSELRGVYHTAGVLQDGLIPEIDALNIKAVLAPKVLGAWHLHEVTKDLDLQECVFYSSVYTLFGNPGQLSYCVANAFMDALAHFRRSKNLPAISINWGPWKNAGMASALNTQMNAKGFVALNNNDYFTALESLLATNHSQMMIAKIDWDKIRQTHERLLPILDNQIVNKDGEQGAWIILLKEKSMAERGLWLRNQLRQRVRSVLELTENMALSDEEGFFDLGMDSLMAVNLRNQLQHLIGPSYPLNPTAMLDLPNIDAVYDHFTQELLADIFNHNPVQPQKLISHTVDNKEPIAIIGMGCRLPGGANTVEQYWDLLKEGRDAITEVPKERWNINDYFDPDMDAPGKIYCRFGGFLDTDVALFDAQFFGINAKEAAFMDPQYRLALEVTWEALENAGISPRSLKGSRTGVFFGVSTNDYRTVILDNIGVEGITAYYGLGVTASAGIGRISYLLGLNGPNFPIDTACSSSLVAAHQGCESLRRGETDMALVGGVNLMLTAEATINFCRAHMLARDGHCKTFDKDADGYARGEGCGVVVLKRLSDAMRDGDQIYALIKGSAVNQDGEAAGLTVPNGRAQEALIAEALQMANIAPKDIQFVEAHGTGTSLGDPIEVQSLSAILHQERDANSPVYLSSAKTYIGHLEAAAGIAGLIKTVLTLQNKFIPPHRNFNTLNPMINLDKMHARIPVQGHTFVNNDVPLRAGISAFGFSGTNAHLVLEQAPQDYISHKTSLPLTQFNRQRYWVSVKKPVTSFAGKTINHPIWAAYESLSNQDYVLNGMIDLNDQIYLKDHVIFKQTLFPAASFLESVLFAGNSILQLNQFEIRDSMLHRPLPLHDKTATQIQLIAKQENSNYAISICSKRNEQQWIKHITATVQTAAKPLLTIESLEQLQARCTNAIDVVLLYKQLADLGMEYGPYFQGFQSFVKGKNCALAKLKNNQDISGYFYSPTILDAALLSISVLTSASDEHLVIQEVYLPFQVDCIQYQLQAGRIHYVFVELSDINERQITSNVLLLDEIGRVAIKLTGCKARRSSKKQMQALLEPSRDLYVIPAWQEMPLTDEFETADNVIIEDLRFEQDPLVAALQVLARIQQHTDKSYIIVTQGLYSGENPVSGALMGLIKTALLELPLLDCKLIDTDNMDSIINATAINEPIQAYCDNKLYVPRLMHHQAQDVSTPIFDKNANYIITGGLGALGSIVTEWLIQQGVTHIYLVSRRALSLEIQNKMDALGVDIKIISSDLSDKKQVDALMELATKDRPLKGIFHLAGVLADGLIAEQNAEKFATVFRAKVQTAWNLHEATQAMNLDYFVLFSSIASSQGSLGQSNYAAANGFLDQLAIYRNKHHLPAVSINWGGWSDVGMAAHLTAKHQQRGLNPFNKESGLAALTYCLMQNLPVIQAADICWDEISKRMSVVPSWMSLLFAADAQSKGYLVQLLAQADGPMREVILKSELERLVRMTLGISDEKIILDVQGFFEMGMDSLMAVELKNRMQTAIGDAFALPLTWTFEHTSIQSCLNDLKTRLKDDYFPEHHILQDNENVLTQANALLSKYDYEY